MFVREVVATMAGASLAASLLIAPAWSQSALSASPAPTPTPVETFEYHHTALDRPFATMGRVTDAVRLSLTPATVAAQVGQPVSVDLWMNSATGKPLMLCFQGFDFSLRFVAADSNGKQLQQLTAPFSERPRTERSSQCFLRPNEQLHYVVPLAEYLRIDTPGDYSLTAVLKADWKMRQQGTLQSNSIVLHVTK